jgi:hypothetical protein
MAQPPIEERIAQAFAALDTFTPSTAPEVGVVQENHTHRPIGQLQDLRVRQNYTSNEDGETLGLTFTSDLPSPIVVLALSIVIRRGASDLFVDEVQAREVSQHKQFLRQAVTCICAAIAPETLAELRAYAHATRTGSQSDTDGQRTATLLHRLGLS